MSGSWASRCSSRLASRSVVCRNSCSASAVCGGCLLGLLVLEIALDLELAKIADERAGFACQTLGLPLKRADAIGDAPRCVLGRLRGLLRARDGGSQRNRHNSDRNGTRESKR